MSDEDDANYRRRISEVLRRRGFGWVIEQAEAQIAEGKQSSKQVSERELVPMSVDFTIRRPRSRRASLITSEPYTENERLEIVLQAIEAALVQRSMIEQAVLDLAHNVSIIRFEPDSPVEESEAAFFGAPHTLEVGRRASAVALEAEARAALDGMRRRDHAGA